MKKIVSLLCTAATLLGVVSSCQVMDHYPHNAVSRDSVSEEDLNLLFTGLYNFAQYKPTFNGYFQNDMAGGDFNRGGSSAFADAPSWIKDCMLITGGWISGPWNGYYSWLYQVNSFLLIAQKAEQTDDVLEMEGVARFFRALVYYDLTTKYRNVPLLTEPSDEQLPAASQADIWKVVNEDLAFAEAHCSHFSSKYYVSLEAVQALIARALLAQNRKAEAATYAEKLIAASYFGLDEYEKIFRGQENREEIFTFSNLADEHGINFSTNFYQANPMYAPTQEVVNLFVAADKRRDVTIGREGNQDILFKYLNKNTSDPIIVFRLAEMYLISAEGKGIAGGGLQRLNELRAFRGLPAVTPAPATEEEFVDAVLAERRLEFLGEGFRWFDLVRTGRYEAATGLETKYTVFPIPLRELELNENLEQNELWK